MSEILENKVSVSPEDSKGAMSRLQDEGWSIKSGIDHMASGQNSAMSSDKMLDSCLPGISIAANDAAGDELATGRHHGGYYPYQPGGFGAYTPPESSGQFQTNTGSADFERTGHNNAFHHPFGPGGWYPGESGTFTPPESSGQFQTNTGVADFIRTGHNNAFHHPFGPGGWYPNAGGFGQFTPPESSGQFQTNTGVANFERTGRHHHGGYYPYPNEGAGHYEPPFTILRASGGYNTQVRGSQKI